MDILVTLVWLSEEMGDKFLVSSKKAFQGWTHLTEYIHLSLDFIKAEANTKW
jgi:hypothetical protein